MIPRKSIIIHQDKHETMYLLYGVSNRDIDILEDELRREYPSMGYDTSVYGRFILYPNVWVAYARRYNSCD